MKLDDAARAKLSNGADLGNSSITSNGDAKGNGKSYTDIVKGSIWHGGSAYDAWLNAVAAQVGSVILTLPYTFAQVGYGFGIGFQVLYGAFGCWTVFLLTWLYTEVVARTRNQGLLHERHILQYHEVIKMTGGALLGNLTLAFNMTALFVACVIQLIACSSDIYYMNSSWNKRQWLYLCGALAVPSVLLPSIHNFRIVSILGIATTTLTSAYMTTAALQHGQIPNVRHQGPKSLVQFFTGSTNVLFAFGSHGLCVEIMEAMWQPRKYKSAYFMAVLYTYLLTIPDSVSVYWAYGDSLLNRSNAFGVLPPSKLRNVSIVAMVVHQRSLLQPSRFFPTWKIMFIISAIVSTWVFIVGFGFGGWASSTNFIRQINSFGFFEKCYQCPKS